MYGNFQENGYNAAYNVGFYDEAGDLREYQTQQLLQNPFPPVYRCTQDEIPYFVLPLDSNELVRDNMVGGDNSGYDLSAMATSPPANQMIPQTPANPNRGSSMRPSRSSARSSAPQHTRSRGRNEAAQVPNLGYNMPRDDSPWVAASPQVADFQPQGSGGYTTERFRGSVPYGQTAPLQGTTAVTLEHGNNQRPAAAQPPRRPRVPQGGSPGTQAQISSMQNFVTRVIHAHPSSTTSSSASGSTGATFSSVSTSEHGGFRRRADAVLPLYQLSQLQIADSAAGFDGNTQPSRSSHGGHAYPSATYGQVPATRPIPQQDVCSHCSTCMHMRSFHPSHPPAQYAGDNTTVGGVRIGYCPIRGCNRGPGSRRPFPRTCNLLEHLRGVHRADIPRGAKLRAWLVDQGYDPDLLVEYVNRN